MGQKAAELLSSLLEANDLTDAARSVGDAMVKLRWGSATVVAAISGESLVIKAPMFRRLPEERELEFAHHLLSLNGNMAGLASFATTAEGSVVLVAGRSIEGLDASEFRLILSTVGKFADAFDDLLHAEYYASADETDS